MIESSEPHFRDVKDMRNEFDERRDSRVEILMAVSERRYLQLHKVRVLWADDEAEGGGTRIPGVVWCGAGDCGVSGATLTDFYFYRAVGRTRTTSPSLLKTTTTTLLQLVLYTGLPWLTDFFTIMVAECPCLSMLDHVCLGHVHDDRRAQRYIVSPGRTNPTRLSPLHDISNTRR